MTGILKYSHLILLFFVFIQVAAQELHTKSNKALKAYNAGKSAYDFVDYSEAEEQLKLAALNI